MPKKCCTSVSVDLPKRPRGNAGKDGKPIKDGMVLVITGQTKNIRYCYIKSLIDVSVAAHCIIKTYVLIKERKF